MQPVIEPERIRGNHTHTHCPSASQRIIAAKTAYVYMRNHHMAITPRLLARRSSLIHSLTLSSLAITSRTKTALQHSTMGCLGQVRGRAPASAAIRFELVVHVQAPDRWELLVVRRASSSRQYVGEANSGTHTHAECTSEWWKLGRASCPACPSLRRAWD